MTAVRRARLVKCDPDTCGGKWSGEYGTDGFQTVALPLIGLLS